MAMVRFDPYRELETLQSRMNHPFGNFYLRDEFYPRDEDVSRRGTWVPPVDIYETGGHDLVVTAELPDMAREDIEVTVENSSLTLRGTRALPSDVKEEQFRRIERSYGPFTRSFTLPNTVDASGVSAEYKNGVLVVKLPFREEAKPRKINIGVAA